MKTLYRYVLQEQVNDEIINIQLYGLRYGEPTHTLPKQLYYITDFYKMLDLCTEIKDCSIDKDKTLFTHQDYLFYSWRIDLKKWFSKDFHNYIMTKYTRIYDNNGYTIKELQKLLPTEEYMQWAKDNKY